MMMYEKIGFRCGLEIHQQLEGTKLFCNCASEIRKDNPDYSFDRRLRASAGESGQVDIAAAHEQSKGKLFTYVGYDDITCLVEMDEEPPGPLNPTALGTAIQVCKMLNCDIADKIQVMRKTVVDGSNVSGFQRTALVGRNGFIEVNGEKIGVSSVCIEEEACQVIKRTKDHDTYNLSRLGITLIEIATDPDISNPEECKAVAAELGMILRSTEACKRGIGSIRQDVNISIKGGARTEIKGFQDLKSIPKVVENEIIRQQKLIKTKKKILKEVRKAESNFSTSFLRPMPGAARMYPETDVPTIEITEAILSIQIPELIGDKLNYLEKKYGIGKDKLKKLLKFGESKFSLFEKIAKNNKNISPGFVAETLLSYVAEISRIKGADPVKIKNDHLVRIFEELNSGNIAKGSINDILMDISLGKGFTPKNYELEDIDLNSEIKKIVDKNSTAPIGALMGMIMGKFKGKVDGKEVMQILKKHAK